MKAHRIIGGALVVLFLATGAICNREARATADSTDETDLWWNPNESGWGMQVVQTGSTIFVTMFVYDRSGSPIWYTATGIAQGNYVWTGDLYQTNGPWFGTTPFNPAAVSLTKVGTLTFAASSVNDGTATYSVNGVVVTKTIQRQTMTYDNFDGNISGHVQAGLDLHRSNKEWNVQCAGGFEYCAFRRSRVHTNCDRARRYLHLHRALRTVRTHGRSTDRDNIFLH